MVFTYYGNCYYCGQDTYITSTPVGGMRLCEECLRGVFKRYWRVIFRFY